MTQQTISNGSAFSEMAKTVANCDESLKKLIEQMKLHRNKLNELHKASQDSKSVLVDPPQKNSQGINGKDDTIESSLNKKLELLEDAAVEKDTVIIPGVVPRSCDPDLPTVTNEIEESFQSLTSRINTLEERANKNLQESLETMARSLKEKHSFQAAKLKLEESKKSCAECLQFNEGADAQRSSKATKDGIEKVVESPKQEHTQSVDEFACALISKLDLQTKMAVFKYLSKEFEITPDRQQNTSGISPSSPLPRSVPAPEVKSDLKIVQPATQPVLEMSHPESYSGDMLEPKRSQLARQWMTSVFLYFEATPIKDEAIKMAFSVGWLSGSARRWAVMLPNIELMTLKDFLKEFKKNFIATASYHASMYALKRKFQRKDQSVSEYAAEFREIYSTLHEDIPDRVCSHLFIAGLRTKARLFMVNQPDENFLQVINSAINYDNQLRGIETSRNIMNHYK